ncbi:uncharacterized protein AB9X84_024698 isoform 2-T2 [Acanthopagrus schlegelii]
MIRRLLAVLSFINGTADNGKWLWIMENGAVWQELSRKVRTFDIAVLKKVQMKGAVKQLELLWKLQKKYLPMQEKKNVKTEREGKPT